MCNYLELRADTKKKFRICLQSLENLNILQFDVFKECCFAIRS